MRSGHLFERLTAGEVDPLTKERVQRLATGAGVRVERIVSTGQSSPEGHWYDQDEDELVVLLRGSAALEIEGREGLVELEPGAWTLLPARCRHRVARTAPEEPTVWLAIHFAGG